MRRLSLFLIAISMFILILGCQSEKSISLNGKEATKVNLSEFKEFGTVNKNVLIEFTNDKDIEVFVNAIKDAEKINGILDVANADYDIHIVFKDNSTKDYHLWVSKDSGMIMDIENTNIGYSLTKKSANMIHELVAGKEKTMPTATPTVTSQSADIAPLTGQEAIAKVIKDNPLYPDKAGSKETIENVGGKQAISCTVTYETKVEPNGKDAFYVTLTKTWDTKIKGETPIIYTKYNVTKDGTAVINSKTDFAYLDSMK